jgi:predicted SprT family Zn-dependent metalloprotease
MIKTDLRTFAYFCQCGHQVKVFCDSGKPQEFYKCRSCGLKMKREEI